ncbi:hypothetical protein AHMF7616_02852 [Adhaeribacter pallidiroseus]|uniref:Uncharacterized protein n=1 Tax=Adhaeribacter pallidiroseus TaxID=2072847 RepID=A0A369QIW3_9BACT|nr:hypothetical protein AHMF7616_02852 [Adhaeribacter pallidiroseus]
MLLFLLIGVPCVTVISVLAIGLILKDPKQILVLMFPLLMACTLLLLIYHLKYKWDIVEIDKEQLRVKKLFGLGKEITIGYSDITAIPSYENVKIGNGEILIIEANGKRVTEISDFTYSNFKELVSSLKEKIKLKEYSRRPFIERMKLALK